MHQKLRHGVPNSEHDSISTLRPLNWEDIRIFVSLARASSFRAASQQLAVSVNTLRRHIERLEDVTGEILVARHTHGVALTSAGRAILARARAMEEAATEVSRLGRKSPLSVSGRVRIFITEGLGTLWLVPRLVRFQRAHPNLIIEVNCTFRQPDVSRMEADVSIQITKPELADLIAVRLGRMHVMPFASPEYLRTFGVPTTLKEVESHKIVEQLSPQLDVTAVDRLFPSKPKEGFVSLTTNTSTAHLWAVAAGAGLGMLPTYVSQLGTSLVPIDIGLTVSHDIWMSYHPDARRLRRVGLAIDWIRESFDNTQFPWFGANFIHPDKLKCNSEDEIADNKLVNLIWS